MTDRIETQRLLLRAFVPEEADLLHRLCADPQVEKNGITWLSTPGQCRQLIDRWQTSGEGMALVRKADGAIIGYGALGEMGRYPGYEELEIVIGTDFRGQGLGAEAVGAMAAYGFERRRLAVIAAWIRGHNTAAARMVEKAGFTPEGRLRRHARDGGDTLCYSLLREEWRACV